MFSAFQGFCCSAFQAYMLYDMAVSVVGSVRQSNIEILYTKIFVQEGQ